MYEEFSKSCFLEDMNYEWGEELNQILGNEIFFSCCIDNEDKADKDKKIDIFLFCV